jgi:catechol 2,3-dioxygenase-like lactoylglutathione lyase family enzyme
VPSVKNPRIQHVSVPRPPGPESAEQARAFYSGVLGLREKPVPETIAHLDLVWFDAGETELHVFAEAGAPDSGGRHFCLEFDDIGPVRARLEAAGYRPWDPEAIRNRPRFFCKDPFGNTVECTTILGEYLA